MDFQKNAKNTITKEYSEQLKQELEHLINVERPSVLKQIQEAREQGDLSENADYDSARNRQGEIESRISEIKSTLENSVIISAPVGKSDKVTLLTYVLVEELDTHEEIKYYIVGNQGADPLNNLISSESPLAKALLGHKVGDIVEIKGIESPYSVKILQITAN